MDEQPRISAGLVPDAEEKSGKRLQKGTKRKQPARKRSKSLNKVYFEGENEEDLVPLFGSEITVLSFKKEDSESKSKSQPCLYPEHEGKDENEEKKLSYSKVLSEDCIPTKCENEKQKSKMSFRECLKQLPQKLRRKKPVLFKSKSCGNIIDEDDNQRQNHKGKEKGLRMPWEIFRKNKKRSNSIKTKSDDNEEESLMMSFPELSSTRAQLHPEAMPKDNGGTVSENDERKEFMVASYKLSEEPIGFGAFGTCVYSGVNTKDYRKVAIKKINCHTTKQSSKYEKEVRNLLILEHCPNVVNYLDVEVGNGVVYIMLELMEGTLETLVNRPGLAIDFVELSHDIGIALQFLRKKEIIHRDIKPRNILFVFCDRLMLKLADFGLSKMIGSDSSTYNGGTRCWMAPEVLKSLDKFSPASDVFSAGLVLHYLMTSRHPFAPTDVTQTNENILLVEHTIIGNILNKKLNAECCLSPETLHLIYQMVNHDRDQRPDENEVLAHPFFWSNKKKMKFLEATANQPEIYDSGVPSRFKKDLGSIQLGAQFKKVPWSEQSPAMEYVYNEMIKTGRRGYDTTSVADLLRFIRNAYQHVSEPGRTAIFQKFVLEEFIFLNEFKSLFTSVYQTVRNYGWHKNKKEIEYEMS